MAMKSASADRGALALGVILLVLVFFFAVNLLAGNLFRSARLDLTEDRLFTISDGTQQTLGLIEEPIILRYYRSEELDLLGPFYTGHANRVEDLLTEYVERSGGKLSLERYDPEPFSPEEDLAVADGLQGITVDVDGSQVYFGLSGINSTDDRRALPLLAPERANFLEYDLTRLIFDLAQPEKPKVAILGNLEMRGSQADRFTRWVVVDQASQFFDVTFLGGELQQIEEDVSILLLAQPMTLDDASLYAIDQFVLRGGRVLAFVDPFPEAIPAPGSGQPPEGNAVVTMEPLLESWGVSIDSERFVGDRTFASRVQALHEGRQVIVDYLARFDASSVAQRVRCELLEQLPSGHACEASVAGALHLTARTLQRRLREEGTSFRALLDEARHELAYETDGIVVVTTAPNEFHEIGAWMIANTLEGDGWDIHFLGSNTPKRDLLLHLKETEARISQPSSATRSSSRVSQKATPRRSWSRFPRCGG